MRFPLLAITAVAAAFATSNANATDATIICHFGEHNIRMESKASANDTLYRGDYDTYDGGSYLGQWHYYADNTKATLVSPDKGIVVGVMWPAPRSITPDQLAHGVPLVNSMYIIVNTNKGTPGDCTVYPRK
jgi:hypothetical protein